MDVVAWAKEHPYEAGGIGLVGALVILYMLGYIGGGSGGGSGGSSANNVAAYYAAENAQTQAGTAVQIATVQSAAQTAQVQAEYGAATQIAADQYNSQTQIAQTQTTGAVQIAASQYGSATQIAESNNYAAMHSSDNQLLATENTNSAAVQENNQNNAWATQQQTDAENGNVLMDWIDKVIAPESWTHPGMAIQDQAPTVSNSYSAFNPAANPNGLAAVGYSPTQIDTLLGIH